MMTIENSPIFLFYGISILAVCGLLLFIFGKKLPASGEWVLWLALFAAMAIGILDFKNWSETGGQVQVWRVGWVWPKDEIGALTVGMFQDPIGIALSLLTFALTAISLLKRETTPLEKGKEHIYSALALSSAGVALSWYSVTPWLAFFGIVLTILAGFVSSGSDWESNETADKAMRFLMIAGSGLIVALVGACILSASRPALLFTKGSSLLQQMDAARSLFAPTWLGTSLLIAGLYIQIQSIPFVGLVKVSSGSFSLQRLLLTQLFPAWAVFAMFFRLEPQFREVGLFPSFGWLAIITTVLAVLPGLLNSKWNFSLRVWLASGLSLVLAVLAFSGQLAAFGMLIGLSLGVFMISSAASALLDQSRPKSEKTVGRNFSLKTFVALGAAAGTGFIGFASAQSSVLWILSVKDNLGFVVLFLVTLFLHSLLGWKLAWNLCRIKVKVAPSWTAIMVPFLALILSLGVIWTGTLTGGKFLNNSDRVFRSAFDAFFGNQEIESQFSQNFIAVLSVLIFALITTYWLSGRKEDKWEKVARDSPRISDFTVSGYGIKLLFNKTVSGLANFGKGVESVVDQGFWSKWLPNGLFTGITALSSTVSIVNQRSIRGINHALRTLVEVPAKLLQVVQTGDLRWYLIFALSAGFGLLIHFLYFLQR